ncbi:MAG: hypothetical protein AB8B85_02970 [Paracoccaceae bacterium]
MTADLCYLRYEDLVREFQRGGLASRLGRGLRALAGYISDGALRRIGFRTSVLMAGPYLVAFAPVVAFAALSGTASGTGAALAILMGLSAYLLLVRYRMLLVCDLFAYMRVLARGTGEYAENHNLRLDQLQERVALETGAQTLIVGHSLGGLAAIRSVAAMLERLPSDASLGLLTLGSVHGIVLAQRGAGRDRLARDIARICADARVEWVDVTSPRDAFCVPLTDPLLQIGADAKSGMQSPRIISAQLRNAPSIPGDRRTVFAAMRRHMGYLLAPAPGSGFDYVDTVTGTPDLGARFGDRGNSPKARMWHG